MKAATMTKPIENTKGASPLTRTPCPGRVSKPITKQRCVLTAIWLLLFSAAAPVFGDNSSFYRVTTVSNQVILSLSAEGTLNWSAPTGYYRVEKSLDLSGTNWIPQVRGTSETATVSLKVVDFNAPKDLVYIPAGYFTMGDIFNDMPGVGTPIHEVYVSGFYIYKYEATNEKMAAALNWAYAHNRIAVSNSLVYNIVGDFEPLMQLDQYDSVIFYSNGNFTVMPGRANHPAIYLTWFGCAIGCNFMSELEGLTPCYNVTNWDCDFNTTGYRLPTESEWERAARGGYEGYRFEWINTSNTITYTLSNYRCNSNIVYDVSPIQDYNPAGGPGQPLTTPVGYFQANGFGLYDMSGNNWEFCWDWSGNYPYGLVFDPKGPATGTWRIFRGGSWRTTAERVTCGSRYLSFPTTSAFDDIGFRVARSRLN
jgi:formylglycine-generating enzyme